MKFASKSAEEIPSRATETQFHVERTRQGFWCHDAQHRSSGRLAETPLAEVLKWVVTQIIYGHCEEQVDGSGDVVGLSIGRDAPYDLPTLKEAAAEARRARLGVNIAGLIATAREKGTSRKSHKFESEVWAKANSHAHRRMEMHYALEFCELLGRATKKLKKLDLLPIMESAPESTRVYLAEATRCYLLKLNRGCIALCRACLENTLECALTARMRQDQQAALKAGQGNRKLQALIEECAERGVLDSTHGRAAHDIQAEANSVLHRGTQASARSQGEVAWNVLRKTRALVSYIHGNGNGAV